MSLPSIQSGWRTTWYPKKASERVMQTVTKLTKDYDDEIVNLRLGRLEAEQLAWSLLASDTE